jgi:hypothetical protein
MSPSPLQPSVPELPILTDSGRRPARLCALVARVAAKQVSRRVW